MPLITGDDPGVIGVLGDETRALITGGRQGVRYVEH
jgi:hypothetical protein